MITNKDNICNSNTPEFQILENYDNTIADLEDRIRYFKQMKNIVEYNIRHNCEWNDILNG